MKKLLIIPFLFLTANLLAVDKIVTSDPTKPNYNKISSIVITNGAVITSTNSIAPMAVQAVTTSAGAADAGKLTKLNAHGLHDPSTLGTGVTSNFYLRAVSPTNAVWTSISSSGAQTFNRFTAYSSAGTFAWTNSFGVTNVFLEIIAGGGGGGGQGSGAGGGGGGGGSSGGKVIAFLTITNGAILDVRAGSGGSGGAGGDSYVQYGTNIATATGGAVGSDGVASGSGGAGGSGGGSASGTVVGSEFSYSDIVLSMAGEAGGNGGAVGGTGGAGQEGYYGAGGKGAYTGRAAVSGNPGKVRIRY